MNVEVHIERLVLQGFERRDASVIAAAMRAELTRLLDGGVAGLRDGRTIARLGAGSVNVVTAAGAAGVGRDAARAVHRAVLQ